MEKVSRFCGIDVSSTSLDYIVFSSTDTTKLSSKAMRSKSKSFIQIPNELDSIAMEFGSASFDDTLFVLEATGSYSAKLLHQLSKLNRPISVVSPYQSKSYMAAKGVTNKNDKNAAFCLASMGKNENLRLYKAPSMDTQHRKQLFSSYRALQKQAQMLNNQIHALEQYPCVNEQALEALKQVLFPLNTQIRNLEEQLYKPSQDPDYEEKVAHGSSVIGIGKKTAHAILLATNGLKDFDSAAAVAKCLGITPESHRAGTSIHH